MKWCWYEKFTKPQCKNRQIMSLLKLFMCWSVYSQKKIFICWIFPDYGFLRLFLMELLVIFWDDYEIWWMGDSGNFSIRWFFGWVWGKLQLLRKKSWEIQRVVGPLGLASFKCNFTQLVATMLLIFVLFGVILWDFVGIVGLSINFRHYSKNPKLTLFYISPINQLITPWH